VLKAWKSVEKNIRGIKMGKGNIANLKPFTKENAKKMGRKGGIKNGENAIKRKAMREIYEEIIETQSEKIKRAFEKGIDEGNLQYIKELREATEGKTVNINADVKAEMLTTEDLITEYKELAGLE
jgi:hypothetical protein